MALPLGLVARISSGENVEHDFDIGKRCGMASPVSVLPQEWVPIHEAMRQLEKSAKTVERLVNAGHLRSKLTPREGKKPERLYHAGDLDRIKQEAIPAPANEPRRSLVPDKTTAIGLSPQTVTTLTDIVARCLDRPITVREKLWLTLDEARAYSGRSRQKLLQWCRNGKVIAERDGGWRIYRESLESCRG